MSDTFYQYSESNEVSDSVYNLPYPHYKSEISTSFLQPNIEDGIAKYLDDVFVLMLIAQNSITPNSFLQYHFIKYNGKKFDFLVHTQIIIQQAIKRIDIPYWLHPSEDEAKRIVVDQKVIYEYALEWLKGKISEVKAKNNIDESDSIFSKLEWDNKTEMVQLIYALSKSKRIRSNGKPLSQKQLIEIFEKLFSTDLNNFHDLLKSGLNTFKSRKDEKRFTIELNNYIDDYLKDQNS